MKVKSLFPLIAGMIVLFSSAAAFADPPSRVGRVSYAEGDVSARTPDQDDWYSTTVNVPVTTGDAFWTERDARLEIQIGGAEIRLDHNTELDVTQLDDEGTVIEVPEGVISIHVRHMMDEEVEVLTPQGETEIREPGTYHIDTGHPRGRRPADRDYITVLEGRARFKAGHRSLMVRAGDMAVVAGYPPSISVEDADTDEFDNWAEDRDRHMRITHSHRYVSPMMTGYEDLDTYGHWGRDPQYGQIWYPDYIPADWAPYRYGHWAYVSPWGWTWVDDQPWGFAPFHYGRWVHHRDRWAWYPGVVEERPVYAPALVAFIGGRNFGISLSLGNSQPVGWVPLAPDEPFHPYYDVSDHYRVAVNRTTVNQTIINNTIINNRTVVNNYARAATSSRLANRNAATVIPATAFVKGSHVKNSSVQVSEATITQAAVAPPEAVAKLQPTAEAKAGGESKPGRVAHQAARPQTGDVARERMREVRQQHRADREAAQRMNQIPDNNANAGQFIRPAAPASPTNTGNVTSTNSTSVMSAKNPAEQSLPTGTPVEQSQQIQSDRPLDERHRGRHEEPQREDINSGASPAEQATEHSNSEGSSKDSSMEERRARRFDRQSPADSQESISAGQSTNPNEQAVPDRGAERRHRGPHDLQEEENSRPNAAVVVSPNADNPDQREMQNKIPDFPAKNSAEQPSATGTPVEQSQQIQSDRPFDERHRGRHEHPQQEDINSGTSPAEQAVEHSNPGNTTANDSTNPNAQSAGDPNTAVRHNGHEIQNDVNLKPNNEEAIPPNTNNHDVGQKPQNSEDAAPVTQSSPPHADANGGSKHAEKMDRHKMHEENKDASVEQRNNGQGHVQEQSADGQQVNEKRHSHKKNTLENEPDSDAPKLDSTEPSSNNQAQ